MQTVHSAAIVAVIVFAGIVSTHLLVRKADKSENRVERDLKVCRKIGIPTSGAELQPPLTPDSENAATIHGGWKALA